MPLSAPAERQSLHHRDIRCVGFKRTDGLWDIEGRLTDSKDYAFPNRWRGMIRPSEAIHDMWVRLTVDAQLLIHQAEAATDGSPFGQCGIITPKIRQLEGKHIGPGWRKLIRQELGGTTGCTHINELLGILATVAYQSVYSGEKSWAQDNSSRPAFIDTCHIWASNGETVQQYFPQHYISPHSASEKK